MLRDTGLGIGLAIAVPLLVCLVLDLVAVGVGLGVLAGVLVAWRWPPRPHVGPADATDEPAVERTP